MPYDPPPEQVPLLTFALGTLAIVLGGGLALAGAAWWVLFVFGSVHNPSDSRRILPIARVPAKCAPERAQGPGQNRPIGIAKPSH